MAGTFGVSALIFQPFSLFSLIEFDCSLFILMSANQLNGPYLGRSVIQNLTYTDFYAYECD